MIDHKPKRDYQICTKSIMDTSDPKITFDENGVCDFVNNYYQNILPNWHPNEIGIKKTSNVHVL